MYDCNCGAKPPMEHSPTCDFLRKPAVFRREQFEKLPEEIRTLSEQITARHVAEARMVVKTSEVRYQLQQLEHVWHVHNEDTVKLEKKLEELIKKYGEENNR